MVFFYWPLFAVWGIVYRGRGVGTQIPGTDIQCFISRSHFYCYIVYLYKEKYVYKYPIIEYTFIENQASANGYQGVLLHLAVIKGDIYSRLDFLLNVTSYNKMDPEIMLQIFDNRPFE